MNTLISLLLLINYAYSQTPEGCNFVIASADPHFYPIGACDKTKTKQPDAYSSFKFVCQAGDVFKYEYDTDEYCHGTPISSTNFTDQVEDSECTQALCDWSETCTYTGCYNSTSETCECSISNDESHCIPFLVDQCITNSDGDLLYSDCDNTDPVNELITDYFSAPNCTDDSSIFNTTTQGGSDASKNCINEQYYTSECYTRSIPTCNYAADGFIHYPINACDTTKSTTGDIVTYSAFKYICDAAGDVYKYEYDTSDYCKGTPISQSRVNAELSHYECNLNDCKFADLCELSLNECDSSSSSCDYDSSCLPHIVDNCMGFVGGQLLYDTCVNDTLTAGTYFGIDCETPYNISTDIYSGYDDLQCGAQIFSKVQCIDPIITDANSIIYHTTQCNITTTPTASTTQYYTTFTPTSAPTTTTTQLQTVECSPKWTMLVRFVVRFLVAVTDYKQLIETLCKNAFINAASSFLDTWGDDLCVDVSNFNIIPHDARRLLPTEYELKIRRLLDPEEYEIEIEFEYNDELQDAVFGNDEYNSDSFSQQFGSSVEEEFVADNLVESGSVSGLEVMPAQRIDDDSGHKLEGALVNGVVVISFMDGLIFIGCMTYVYSRMKKRLIEKGHDAITFEMFIKQLTWKEYLVCCVEVLAYIIYWIFVIDVIAVGKTYLGYIGLIILILGGVVLVLRYILYKKLCIEHVNDIMGNINVDIGNKGDRSDTIEDGRKNDLINEVRFRQVDLAMIGLLLMTIQEIPIIIFMIIIGENWDYHSIIVLCFVFVIISIIMKILLLIKAKYGPIETKSVVKTKNAIELGNKKDKKDDNDGKKEEETDGKKEEETDGKKEEETGKNDDKKEEETDKNDDKKEEETDVVKTDNDKSGVDKKTETAEIDTGDNQLQTDDGIKKTDDGSKKTDDGGDKSKEYQD